MAALDLTPEEQADRLIGWSINHSSNDKPVKALSAVEDAIGVLETETEAHSTALAYLRELRKRHEPTSYRWRESCKRARDELEGSA